MKRFLLKCAALMTICLLFVPVLNFLFHSNSGKYVYHMMGEMYESEENIDLVFLGSSHTYRTYDPALASELLGVKCFNAGTSSQSLISSYYLLREIGQYHDVQTVVLDLYYPITELAENDSSVFILSDYIRSFRTRTALLYASGGLETVFNGLFTARRSYDQFHIAENIRSRSIPIGDYTTVTYPNEEYRGDGFVYSFETVDGTDEAEFAENGWGAAPFSERCLSYLTAICGYCRENDITLLLVNQPIPAETLRYIRGYKIYESEASAFAEENGVRFFNFDLYRGDTGLTLAHYKDGNHLNGEGAERFTELFCRTINDPAPERLFSDRLPTA